MGRFLLELLPSLFAGLCLGWKWPSLPGWLAPLLIRWGVPLSLAALLLRSPLSLNLLRVGVVGVLVPLLSLFVLLGLSPLRQRLKNPVLMLGAAVGNTGYWGLPVALALLPPQAMATAAIYDVAGTLITWGVGPLVLVTFQKSGAWRLSSLVSSPALQGCVVAILISQSPWSARMAQMLWWPARAVFVMALVLLGMRLGLTIRERTLVLSAGLPWALVFKLIIVPALVWLFASLLRLPLIDQQALVLQGAAPTALSVLLMAEAKQEAGAMAASLVLCSTVLAMVSVPLWWGLMH